MRTRLGVSMFVAGLAAACTTFGGGSTGEDTPLVEGPDDGVAPVDPLADAPALVLPQDIQALATQLATAPTLSDAIDATVAVLARAGVETRGDNGPLVPASPPVASAYLVSSLAVDLAWEARQRDHVSRLTASQLAHMFVDLGWPLEPGETPERALMGLLSAWTQAALLDPANPTSFAILFIAANNQRQSPMANLSLETQDPSLVRFSLLDLAVLFAAVDRTTVLTVDQQGFTPEPGCQTLRNAMGQWGGAGRVIAGEMTQSILREEFGSATRSVRLLGVLKLAAKLQKLAEAFYYGNLRVTLDTGTPRPKPLPREADAFGALTAYAGVSQEDYDEYIREKGEFEAAEHVQLNNCLQAMNLPLLTEISDLAADATNWRVSWDIAVGGGTQVEWKQGQQPTYSSRYENTLTRSSDAEASNTVEFRILPQLLDVASGTVRERRALFTAQLRRGRMPDATTLWGAGRTGLRAGTNPENLDQFNLYMGLANMGVDIIGGWALEVLGPKVSQLQVLTEYLPKGWVGTITITETGSGGEATEDSAGGTHAESGEIDFSTTAELGGSAAAPTETRSEAVGTWASNCTAVSMEKSTAQNCFEACPTQVEPGPLDVVQHDVAGVWSAKGDLGQDGALVVMTVYQASAYRGIPDALIPADIRAKFGTWELSVALPGCGTGSALVHDYVVAVEQVGIMYFPSETQMFSQAPINHGWIFQFPGQAAPSPQVLVTGNLSDGYPRQIRRTLELDRVKVLNNGYEVPTHVTMAIDIRRQD